MRRESAGLSLALVGVVALIFGLAYLDLRREQARALDDFSAEQAALARTLAATLAAPVGARVFDGVRQAAFAAPLAPMRWLVLHGARELRLIDGARGRSWSPPPDDAELRQLVAALRAGGSGTLLLNRPAAAALGLPRRVAIAGFAPVAAPAGGAVAVVTSARRVRDRARLAAWRLAAAMTLTALLVGLFALMLARQQRRTQALGAALKLAEATAALRERAETIVERIPVGVMALDGAGAVRAVNPYLAERGARVAERLDAALPGLLLDEQAALERLWTAARAQRQPQQHAGLPLHLGGAARAVDAWVVPLGRPEPDADCFVVLHDRTEERRLAHSLVRAEKLATVGTLAAGVAHELGTPLGIISGRAEQLLPRAGDEPMRKGLTSILAQVDKVSTTIRQLLDFARTRPVALEPVAAAAALAQAAALLEHRFRQAQVRLEVAAAPSLPPLAADPGQLEQVLVNLLLNACDACAKGGHVVARAALADEALALEIADDGCGIAPAQLPSVFDPFFTTKKRGQGTGLGLSIAADIVKNHGGRLTLDSTVGHGTTARLWWPLARPA